MTVQAKTDDAAEHDLAHGPFLREGTGDPLYKRLGGLLVRRILATDARPGTVVGTVAGLAEETGVSVGTVRSAVRELTKRGLVRSVPKRGIVLTSRRSELEPALAGLTNIKTVHVFFPSQYVPARDISIAQYASGMEDYLHSVGGKLVLTKLPSENQVSFIAERLSQTPGGSILLGAIPNWQDFQNVIDILERRGLPFVFMPMPNARRYGLRTRAMVPTVDFDRSDCVREVTHRLREKGHRRVAVAGASDTTARFIGAYIDRARECGIEVTGELLFLAEVPLNGGIGEQKAFGRHVVEGILALKRQPTAICCMHGQLTVAIVEELLARGIDVGKEMSVVTTGFDAMIAEQSPVGLAGALCSCFGLGRLACRTLLDVAAGTYDGSEMVFLPRVWTDGPSLGPAPRRS